MDFDQWPRSIDLNTASLLALHLSVDSLINQTAQASGGPIAADLHVPVSGTPNIYQYDPASIQN